MKDLNYLQLFDIISLLIQSKVFLNLWQTVERIVPFQGRIDTVLMLYFQNCQAIET